MNCYPFIEAEKRMQAQRQTGVRAAEGLPCRLLRSTWPGRLGPRRARTRSWPWQIRAVHEESRGRYGAPRVHAELRRRRAPAWPQAGRPADAPAGLRGRAAKRWKKTTIADPAAAARADRIRRDFTADAASGQLPLVRRHHLHRHLGGVAVPGHRHRHRLPPRRRVRHWPITCAPSWSPMRWPTRSPPATPGRGDLPLRPGLPVHLRRVRWPGRRLRGHAVPRPHRPVLGQRPCRELFSPRSKAS